MCQIEARHQQRQATAVSSVAEQLERAEIGIRKFAGCELKQEFVSVHLQNPGVEDVQIKINTVSCGDGAEDKPTLGKSGVVTTFG